MMAGIGNGDTAPEIAIRKALFARGFRYRLRVNDVPGKPDIVLPRFHAAIFVNGCFWHAHDCPLFRLPQSNQKFWAEKLKRNRERDFEVFKQLALGGWRQLVVWECALKGRNRIGIAAVADDAARWLNTSSSFHEIRGADKCR